MLDAAAIKIERENDETRRRRDAHDAPLPLFPDMPAAEPYPMEALGPTLSRAASAIVAKVQVPDAIAAQSVLAAASLACQAHADVALPYGQTRPLSLYFVTIAASGDRKTTADNDALWPVARREKALREDSILDMKTWKVDCAAWAAERKKIEGNGKIGFDDRRVLLTKLGDEPPRPLAPFLTTGDLTMEGLTKNWASAHAALGVFTAEGGTFTAGQGMNEDNKLKTAAMLSEVWDGKPIKRLRAQDGATILPGRRLAMHILVQPEAATHFLASQVLRDQGLLSRVLVAAPNSVAGMRLYKNAHPNDLAAINAYGARILSIMENDLPLAPGTRNELEPRTLKLSAGATALWMEFYDHVEQQCGRGGDLAGIGDFAAKAAEHAARIAGVLTLVEDLKATAIDEDAMRDALALMDWYLDEACRLQGAARTDPKLLRAADLLRWLHGLPGEEIDFRAILQRGPNALRTKADAEAHITILEAHGWVKEIAARPRKFQIIRR